MMSFQLGKRGGGISAWIAHLDHVLDRLPSKATGQRPQEVLQPLAVRLPTGRQLIQHRTDGHSQRPKSIEQPRDGLLGIAQAFDVGEETAGLHRKAEVTGHLRPPLGKGGRERQAIERAVEFDGIEATRICVEPLRRRQRLGVHRAAPLLVVPPGTPDARPVRRGSTSSVLRGMDGEVIGYVNHAGDATDKLADTLLLERRPDFAGDLDDTVDDMHTNVAVTQKVVQLETIDQARFEIGVERMDNAVVGE